MGISISDVFTASTRQARRGTRERIFLEHQSGAVLNTVAFSFLGVFFLAADWTIDPANLGKAAVIRLACMLVLLLSALVKWYSKSLLINFTVAYLSLVLCEVGQLKLLEGLTGGLIAGPGQLIFLYLGAMLFCWAFPFHYNIWGCVALALVPDAVGEVISSDFPHFLYVSVLWPACASTVFILWRVRSFLIEKQKLLREKESSEIIDPVTGLPNARGLGKSFDRLTKLTTQKAWQNCLLLIEVDGLDKVKATHGPGFSNFLLRKIGELIELSFRDRDIIGSINSNEFACILPNLPQDKAQEIAERFRTIIEQSSFDCPSTESGKFRCTVSIAIVSAEIKEEIKTLLNRARIGVSQAMSTGGNQTVSV